jgi:hypothetical protein
MKRIERWVYLTVMIAFAVIGSSTVIRAQATGNPAVLINAALYLQNHQDAGRLEVRAL